MVDNNLERNGVGGVDTILLSLNMELLPQKGEAPETDADTYSISFKIICGRWWGFREDDDLIAFFGQGKQSVVHPSSLDRWKYLCSRKNISFVGLFFDYSLQRNHEIGQNGVIALLHIGPTFPLPVMVLFFHKDWWGDSFALSKSCDTSFLVLPVQCAQINYYIKLVHSLGEIPVEFPPTSIHYVEIVYCERFSALVMRKTVIYWHHIIHPNLLLSNAALSHSENQFREDI